MVKELQERGVKDFNNELYKHLSRRPEYEAKEMYSSLSKRIDVDDPLYDELQKCRKLISESVAPNPDLTASEIIEIVLRALRDVDFPSPAHGVEVLTNCSSPASIIGSGVPQGDLTSTILLDYFRTSKYKILLEWVSISYIRKIEFSLDKKRALQQIKLKNSEGIIVPVTIQMSKTGELWLIDQLLVKTVDPR